MSDREIREGERKRETARALLRLETLLCKNNSSSTRTRPRVFFFFFEKIIGIFLRAAFFPLRPSRGKPFLNNFFFSDFCEFTVLRARCAHNLPCMARVPRLGWALALALIGHGACFQPVGSPLGRTDNRGEVIGTKSAWRTGRVRAGRLRHVREAGTAVRPDSSESSGYGKAGGDRHGEEGGEEEEKAEGSLLMDYFIRWDMFSCFLCGALCCARHPQRCSTWL